MARTASILHQYLYWLDHRPIGVPHHVDLVAPPLRVAATADVRDRVVHLRVLAQPLIEEPLQRETARRLEGVDDVLGPDRAVLEVLPAGQRTAIVPVRDEADAETRLTYSWEVREPRSSVLLVPDNSGSATRAFYRAFAADYFGEGNWDEYEFWFGFPDSPFVLLEGLRAFDLVFWFDGGVTSPILQEAAVTRWWVSGS